MEAECFHFSVLLTRRIAMSDVVFREGAHVRLRPLEREDVPLMRRWLNDPETTQYLLRAFPLMDKAEEAWFDALSGSTTDYVLGIVARESDALIGTIGLHRIDWRNRTATTGTIIGEKEWRGKGQGTEAKMLLLDFAFNALDLYAIQSRVMATNGRSLRYGEKCGYQEVGRLPHWIRSQDGTRCDEVLLIVTQERWRPLWDAYRALRKLST